MLLVIPGIIIIALAAGGYLLTRGSGAFASDWSRVVGAVYSFVEFKAALRNVRTAGAGRSGGGRFVYKSSYSQAG